MMVALNENGQKYIAKDLTQIESKIQNAILGFDNLKSMGKESYLLDASNMYRESNELPTSRVIVITACLSRKITDDIESYEKFVEQLKLIQTKYLRPDDMVFYNIGSPYSQYGGLPRKFAYDNQNKVRPYSKIYADFSMAFSENRLQSNSYLVELGYKAQINKLVDEN